MPQFVRPSPKCVRTLFPISYWPLPLIPTSHARGHGLDPIAGALIERHPALGADIWAEAQAAFLAHGRDYGAPRELRDLLKSPQILSNTNLLLRATRANGAASAYCPHPNPLRSAVLAPQRRTGGCDRVGSVPPG